MCTEHWFSSHRGWAARPSGQGFPRAHAHAAAIGRHGWRELDANPAPLRTCGLGIGVAIGVAIAIAIGVGVGGASGFSL